MIQLSAVIDICENMHDTVWMADYKIIIQQVGLFKKVFSYIP